MLIQLHEVSKEYRLGQQRIRALDRVSFEGAAGAFIAIMGASGSGKSTLLNLIGGLDRPSHGRLLVCGQDVTRLDEDGLGQYRRHRIGFVFQKFHLVGSLTALENVEFPLIFAGMRAGERRERARGALAAVGLDDRHQHRPGELSGGQQQRVAIARALVNNPDIVLADEPTGNLDSRTSAEIMELLAAICAAGRTLLLVTHDERLAAYAHRVVQMADGAIVGARSQVIV